MKIAVEPIGPTSYLPVTQDEFSGRQSLIQAPKLGRTTLVQCAWIAQRYSPYLNNYYETKKSRQSHHRSGSQTFGNHLSGAQNRWVFEDFPNFVLAEEAAA